MGLDVYGYKNIKLVGDEVFSETLDYNYPHFVVYKTKGDEPKSAGIVDRATYTYEDYHSFRAGSYGSYSRWRDELACMLGYEAVDIEFLGELRKSYAASVWNDPQPGPFVDLINFSDCEGVIGTEVSNKLYNDFIAYRSDAGKRGDWFYSVYEGFISALEMAKDNGCLVYS